VATSLPCPAFGGGLFRKGVFKRGEEGKMGKIDENIITQVATFGDSDLKMFVVGL
jgi:hypothetical protein